MNDKLVLTDGKAIGRAPPLSQKYNERALRKLKDILKRYISSY